MSPHMESTMRNLDKFFDTLGRLPAWVHEAVWVYFLTVLVANALYLAMLLAGVL